MISPATTEFVRLLVSDIRGEGEIIYVYHVARQVPTLNGGHDMKELTELIAQEAIQQRGNVSWDRNDEGSDSVKSWASRQGDGTV